MKKLFCFVGILICFLLSCAETNIQLTTIPTYQTEKIRIFVYAISGFNTSGTWFTGSKEFAAETNQRTNKILKEKEIYEVVKEDDIQTVLGGRNLSLVEWKKNNWKLAKEVGKNVNAKYGLIIERIRRYNIYSFNMILINIESGKHFEVFLTETLEGKSNLEGFISSAYEKLSSASRNDMLSTATSKIRFVPTKISSKIEEYKILEKSTIPKNTQLAVFDIESTESYKIVSLILSESLREQILQLKFILVNRENIKQVLNEIGLQQTGIVDEKQSVQVGKSLAAHQIITGRLGVVGETLVLQVKRIDVQTMRTLALLSINCEIGKEEDLLKKMPTLAEKLTN